MGKRSNRSASTNPYSNGKTRQCVPEDRIQGQRRSFTLGSPSAVHGAEMAPYVAIYVCTSTRCRAWNVPSLDDNAGRCQHCGGAMEAVWAKEDWNG